jgi:quercetin dioxygenase-like cupin family protein
MNARCKAMAATGMCLLAVMVLATEDTRLLRLTPAEIAAQAKGAAGAGTSGVAGILTTTLSGDPRKAGPYTIEIRVPANTRIQAHTHRDERTAVVVSGRWFFGYGAKADEALVKELPAGSFYTEPANVAHFALTRGEGAVVYITGFGPTDTVYTATANTPVHQE